MKKTQGVGEQCDATQHLWCQSGLTCPSGLCQDPTQTEPTYFLARGETCQSSNDCSFYSGRYLYCDAALNTCVNTGGLEPTTQQNYCYQWADCNWGEYCSPYDSTSTIQVPATCKPIPSGFGDSGSFCKIAPSFSQATGECGWTKFCAQSIQDELDAGHTPYEQTTCQSLYSLPEGAQCPTDIPGNQLGIGGNTAGLTFSFCASGPCLPINEPAPPGSGGGTVTVHRCSSADYTYSGFGCRQNQECGRGLTCGCGYNGGGRNRCVIGGAFFSMGTKSTILESVFTTVVLMLGSESMYIK